MFDKKEMAIKAYNLGGSKRLMVFLKDKKLCSEKIGKLKKIFEGLFENYKIAFFPWWVNEKDIAIKSFAASDAEFEIDIEEGGSIDVIKRKLNKAYVPNKDKNRLMAGQEELTFGEE